MTWCKLAGMFARLKKTYFFLILVVAFGCQPTPAPTPEVTPDSAPATGPMVYEGQPLGSRVEGLQGISLVAVADSLTEQLAKAGAPEGVYFIMLSKKIPDQGVIVKAPADYTIEDVKAQASGEISISGPVKFLKDDGLSEFAKERYEMNLANEMGGVIWIDNSADLAWTREDGAPEASATPENPETPAAEEADGQE